MSRNKSLSKLLSMVVATFLVFAMITACASSNNSSPNNTPPAAPSNNEGNTNAPAPEPEEPKTPVTIDFWHYWASGPTADLMNELIAEFEEANPHITVEQLGVSFWDYWTKLSTAVAGGTGPDLSVNDSNTVPQRAKSGVSLNLQPFIDRDSFDLEQFFPVLNDIMKYEGDMYALPLDTNVRLLYYNKAAFREVGLDPEKPPTNWAELAEYADKLTTWKDNSMLDRVGFSPMMGNMYLWTLAWTNGGDFWDDELNPTYNKPENVEALEWMANVQNKYGTRALAAFNTESSALEYSPFIAEKLAMVVDVNNLYGNIKNFKPDLDFGVAPIPFQTTPASWSSGGNLEILDNGDANKAEAAWELAKFLTSTDVQLRMHKANGGLVANRNAALAPELASDPIWATIVEQLEVTKFVEYVEASPTWNGNLVPVIDSVMLGEKTAQEALDDAQKAIELEIENFNRANP